MNNIKTTIIMIGLIMVVAGTTLAPIQSYAIRSGGLPDIQSLKHGIRDGVSVKLGYTDQHMNQENLCYRTNTCRQSDVGQSTLGNDNQVTGFSDQSDNIQQSTTANKTTPTPNPTTATLTVIKIVAGNTTNATSSNFTMHVTGNNPTPANFVGSSAGIVVTLDPGPFSVTETGPTSSFNTTTTGDCSGTIAAGQHLTCTITNTPKTCEECFRSILTTAQITVLLNVTGTTSIEAACTALHQSGVFLDESTFRRSLSQAGVSVTVANELIDCLKATGVVFA